MVKVRHDHQRGDQPQPLPGSSACFEGGMKRMTGHSGGIVTKFQRNPVSVSAAAAGDGRVLIHHF